MKNLDKVELESGLQGVVDLYPEKEESGNVVITTYEFKEKNDPLFNLRAARDGHYFLRMYEGKYVRLHIDGKLYMSDTFMERITNQPFYQKANGRILIAGLGLGLIIKWLLKQENITEIVVIEKFEDVIKLVAPKFKSSKLKIIHGDIFEWLPEKNEKFDCIYFDIWPNISTNNIDDINKLHRRLRKFINKENEKAYMGSWMHEFLKAERRRDRRYGY